MTLWDYANWVTKNSTETVVISGAKFTNNSVVLTNATYANLPIPKYVSLSLRCKSHIQNILNSKNIFLSD